MQKQGGSAYMQLKPNPKWRGDPTFLPDVLRAFGVKVKEFPGWLNRGHGDFGTIQGIIVHHTGSNNTNAEFIARHPQLGLCSQIHLDRQGVATLTGAGIAWHAGKGSYQGWATNNANFASIGIEPQADGLSPWPPEMLDAYYRVCAAILWFLGKRATPQTLLAHWEYSGHVQGKWDPGAGNGKVVGMNMQVFRARVNACIDNPPFMPKPAPPKKKEAETMFDQITRRYQSRVTGSTVTMTPLDALLNTDAHAFIARANTEQLKRENAAIRKELAELKELIKGAK